MSLYHDSQNLPGNTHSESAIDAIDQPTPSFNGDEAIAIVDSIIATATPEHSQSREREQSVERAKAALSRPKGKLQLKLKEYEQELCLEASTIEVCRDAYSDDDISLRDVLTRAHHKLVMLVSELYEMGRNVGDLEAQQLESAKQ
jgi:hypothetical protein